MDRSNTFLLCPCADVTHSCAVQRRPVGRILKLGWPIKCLFPPKVGVARCTFWLKSAKSWGGPGHPGHLSTYGPAYIPQCDKVCQKSHIMLKLSFSNVRYRCFVLKKASFINNTRFFSKPFKNILKTDNFSWHNHSEVRENGINYLWCLTVWHRKF